MLLCSALLGLCGCVVGRDLTVMAGKVAGRVGTGLWRAVGGPYDPETDAAIEEDGFVRDVDRQCRLASQRLDSGDRAGAAALLRSTVETYPDEIDARLQLAGVLEELGRLDEADEAASDVLVVAPQNVEALLLKARLAEARGHSDKALQRYHRALAVSPGNVAAQLRVAELELQAAHPERAAPLLRAVCQSSQTTPAQRVEAMWTLGIAYGREQRWSDAATALAAAAPYRPRMTADDWYQLAYTRHQAGDAAGAARDLQHALELQPDHRGATAMRQELGRVFR